MSTLADKTLSKVSWRLIPFLFVLYLVAYLDRVNVGLAALEMKGDLGFSDQVYGLGAGIFFAGYFLLEVPSNLILARLGARRWIARIMVSWGLVSSAMMLVRSAQSFYVLRFLLGAAEAGFFPGIIYYLGQWFPSRQRARVFALFLTATAMAGVLGGPLSGALLKLKGLGGLAGWQWLFLLEGLPAVVLGLAVWFFLPEGPQEAAWLGGREKAWLAAALGKEEESARQVHWVEALGDRRVLRLSLIYFFIIFGFYGISFWTPALVKAFTGLDNFHTALLSSLPYACACLAMVWVGWHSDKKGERRWHLGLPAGLGALALGLGALCPPGPASLVFLCLAAAGIWSTLGPFWSYPGQFLAGEAAASGVAAINSIGNLGGFAGPYALGWLGTHLGSAQAGLGLLALSLFFAFLLTISPSSKS